MKSQGSRKQNEQNWRELIEKCKSSGKCQREWCTENNVSEKAFYYWRRKLAKETDIPNLYIICDTTDMRKGLKGLLEIVTAKYKLDTYSDSLFLFCCSC